MIKALAIGLSLVLSLGVASAQPKKAPRKRPAPAARQPAPEPAPPPVTPAGDAAPATAPVLTPATPAAPAPAAPKAAPGAPTARPTSTTPTAPAPMKTDEKADPNQKLDRRGIGDYRDVSEANERAASQAFREGNDQLNDGFFVKAAEKYRLALSHWDHPAIHYNLALALINLDQPIEVHEHLNKALQHGADPLEKDKFDHAKEYLRLVEGQLADIEVSCNQPGAKISVDNKEVFVAPGKYTSKVRVGKHTFHGDKEGYNSRVSTPFVGPGEKLRIELKVYTGPELTRYRRKWTRTWMPYAVVGAGVVFGGVGALMQTSAQSDYDAYNAAVARCMPSDPCAADDTTITSLRDSGDTKRMLGLVGYGVAGAAVVSGLTLAWINRRQPYQITPEQLEQEQGQVSVAPIVSPDVMGAMVQGKF